MTPRAVLARCVDARPRLVALGAGALAATGQAPLDLWPATLAGLAVLFHLVRGAGAASGAAWRAWAFGAGYFALALSWIVEPFLVDVARHGWMAPFALGLMAGGLALFWAAAGWVAGREAGPARRILALALGLAVAELARGYVFTGFPWALIGHVWIGTPVMQHAALGGAHLLTAMTLGAVALLFLRRPLGPGAAVLLVAAWWGLGALRLAAPDPAAPAAPVHLRLVQPNAAQHLKWRPDMIPVFFDRALTLTAAPGTPAPDLVIWPETAIPAMLERAGPLTARMARAARGVPVISGVQRRGPDGARNSLAVIGPDGQVRQVYDKHHLVPFGEYMPLQPVFARLGVRGLAANDVYGYAAGPGPRLLDLGGAGRALPLICYEAVFPQGLRTGTRPDWLLQITNDAWFGRISGPYQHLAQARLRAVEQGLPMVRAANTGVSAVIDARGRVLDSLPLNEAGQLTAQLPPPGPETTYARTGDWPVALLWALGLAGMAATRGRGAA